MLYTKGRLGFPLFLMHSWVQRAHLDTEPPRSKPTVLYGRVSRRGSSRAPAVTTTSEGAPQHCTEKARWLLWFLCLWDLYRLINMTVAPAFKYTNHIMPSRNLSNGDICTQTCWRRLVSRLPPKSIGGKLSPALNLLLEKSFLKGGTLFPPLPKGPLRADHTLRYPMTILIPLITTVVPLLLPG